MRRSLFTTLLTSLLGSGIAFANTAVENYDKQNSHLGEYVYGVYGPEDAVEGGNLHIFEKEDAEFPGIAHAYGGYGWMVYNNTVSMDGGTVFESLYGGYGTADVYQNKVVLTGGNTEKVAVYGGFGYRSFQNEVVLAGGKYNEVYGGYGTDEAFGNTVHLVGKGFAGSVSGVEVTGAESHIGQMIVDSLNGETTRSGTIDIYGTGITVGSLGVFDHVHFHMVNGQEKSDEAMISVQMTTFYIPPKTEVTFDAVGAMDWKPGDSVTLVNAKSISVSQEYLEKEYDIYRYVDANDAKTLETAELLATAHLELEQGGTVLKLVVDSTVPEPATGTLSLLALAGLAARRRRK